VKGRLAILLLAVVTVACSVPRAAEDAEYKPRNGYWTSTFTLADPSGQIHLFGDAQASYPETCVRSLHFAASKAEKTNGFVWTDQRYQVLNWSEQTDLTPIKNEITKFECEFKASTDSESKR